MNRPWKSFHELPSCLTHIFVADPVSLILKEHVEMVCLAPHGNIFLRGFVNCGRATQRVVTPVKRQRLCVCLGACNLCSAGYAHMVTTHTVYEHIKNKTESHVKKKVRFSNDDIKIAYFQQAN